MTARYQDTSLCVILFSVSKENVLIICTYFNTTGDTELAQRHRELIAYIGAKSI